MSISETSVESFRSASFGGIYCDYEKENFEILGTIAI